MFKSWLFIALFICSFSANASECPTGLYTYKADITAVYDGDTVTANVDLGFHTWVHGEKLRLFGINAPEMRGKEKVQGKVSRDWLRDKVLNKSILIETIKTKKGNDKKGKYGRYLARLYIENKDGECLSINDELVSMGLAVYKEY